MNSDGTDDGTLYVGTITTVVDGIDT